MPANTLTIGRLAREAGVNSETVRYYQRVGLIREPLKPAQGFRHYPIETIARIRFIKRAQNLGFQLKEIAELLELSDGHCADVRQRAEQKRDQINVQIKDLKAMQQTLNTLIKTCQTDSDNVHCPIVETLTGKRS
jgi:MerR family transcriptional regulator, mercuric resistance operon regulatory protein